MMSVRSCWQLSPCLTESMPDSSKVDPPVAQAKLIPCGGGDASGLMY